MKQTIFKLFILLAAMTTTHLYAQSDDNIVFPADATVWDVTDYGAIPNDDIDDTEAFRAAFTEALDFDGRYGAMRIIYVPNGEYLVSDSLNAKNLNDIEKWNGWRAGFFLQGQSSKWAVIRLKDNIPKFGNPSHPIPVLSTGSETKRNAPRTSEGGGNEAFRHYIRNITIDIGSGNPGAIGIDYLVNNRGGIYDVIIKSSDPNSAGHTGLAMNRYWPGPGIIKNITIEGFDYGIAMLNHKQYGMTFEHVTLKNQKKYGVRIEKNTASIRDLKSDNSVPAVFCEATDSHITLIDAKLKGGAPNEVAIDINGKFYGRNITISGYGKSIEDRTENNEDRTADFVKEYSNFGIFKKYNEAINGAIRLPIKETPEFHTDDLSQWAGVDNSASDDLPAIEAAINSGKPIVYLPRGSYYVSNTIAIKGNVRKFVGLNAYIDKTSNFPEDAPLIRFDGGEGDFTILQNIRLQGDIEHNSSKTLAVVNFEFPRGARYYNTPKGTGDLFFEDVLGRVTRINHPQNVWVRQLNSEFAKGTFFYNKGGTVWLFGYKTEGKKGTLIYNDRGTIELWGGFFYSNNGEPLNNMIVNDNGSMTANYKINEYNIYDNQIVDIKGDTTKILEFTEVPDQNNMPIYSSANSAASSESSGQ